MTLKTVYDELIVHVKTFRVRILIIQSNHRWAYFNYSPLIELCSLINDWGVGRV